MRNVFVISVMMFFVVAIPLSPTIIFIALWRPSPPLLYDYFGEITGEVLQVSIVLGVLYVLVLLAVGMAAGFFHLLLKAVGVATRCFENRG